MSGIWNQNNVTMEARETDKLFRDKLKHATSTPGEESWARLESMLDEKKAIPWFTYARVAAIALLLIATASIFLVWNNEMDPEEKKIAEVIKSSESNQSSNKIVPEVIEEDVLVQEEHETANKQKVIPTNIRKKSEPKNTQNVQPQSQEEENVREQETEQLQIELTNLSIAQLDEVPEVAKEEPKKKRFKSIKITYKRGSTPLPKEEEMVVRQKIDSTGGNKIKDLWKQTREIKPGDIWADMRDAKDNLFQRKQNSKKNNVKNLNK